MTNDTSTDATSNPSSGGASLEGYMYQLNVSVWTALDLLLAKRVARQIVLEPATDEDLESDIEEEPDALTQDMELSGYHLVVQCKLRSTGPWRHEELGRLLAHGTRRKKAKERLQDSGLRYLLITSADLVGVARNLRVETLGDWPPSANMPTDLGNDLPADAGGRVAVLSGMDDEKVSTRTERLLTERFRVPRTNVPRCLERLREDALNRMRGAGHGIWTREAVERIVIENGGYVGESADLEGFVRPTNWADLEGALNTRHALVITGASGTGKTRSAKALIAGLREAVPGIRHEVILGGPERIMSDTASGPVVYEIEDPWGRYRLEPTSVPWNDTLDDILQTAGPDRKFVVTSRSDVLRETRPGSLRQKWIVHLEEENYRAEERVQLFENRLRGLPGVLQPIALRYRKEAVTRLSTPLEMHRYFSVLADGLVGSENEREYVERCLRDAHQTSIETAIVAHVERRDAWPWAAIVWGLFKARPRHSFSVVPAIQAGLSRREQALEDGLEPYLNFLIAGRNLRQVDEAISYQHPRVELGLEQATLRRAGGSSRVLNHLVESLIELDTAAGTDWGTESAANLTMAAREKAELSLALDPRTQQLLDAWIATRLAARGPDFEDDLKLAAAVGSSACIEAEVARWLMSRPARKTDRWFDFDRWAAPQKSEQWYSRVAAYPATKAICEAFIARILPFGRGSFPEDFANQIGRLASDLTSAFRDAASAIISHGYNPSEDAVSHGALADLDEFEVIVIEAVDYLERLWSEWDAKDWLALKNGEYDDYATEHYYENAGEDGHTASEMLEKYVDARRTRDGWAALVGHPLAKGLLHSWLRVLRHEREISEAEWRALLSASNGLREEATAWETARTNFPQGLRALLRACLIDGAALRETRIESVRTAVVAAPDELIAAAGSLAGARNDRRLFELALDLRAAKVGEDDKAPYAQAQTPFLSAIGGSVREVVEALLIDGLDTSLSTEAIEVIAATDTGSNSGLRLAKARILSANGADVQVPLSELLGALDDDSDDAIADTVKAVDLATTREYWALVRSAMQHRFADVREHALKALAAQSSGPLSADLLALAADKGNRVRKALLALLEQRRDASHLPALLTLAADTWSNADPHYQEPTSYPIAWKAAEILLEPPELPDSSIAEIGTIIRATTDSDVQLTLVRAMVRNGSDDARARVMRMALRTGSPPMHRLAAEALVMESAVVDTALAGEVEDAQLEARTATVAYPMTLLVGLRADDAQILSAARTLAASSFRRILLLPLILAALQRNADLAMRLAPLFPPLQASTPQTLAHDISQLSRATLIQFGDVRTVEIVLHRLSDFLASETNEPSVDVAQPRGGQS